MVVVLDQEQVDELEQAYNLPAEEPIPIVGGLEETPEEFKQRRMILDLLLKSVATPAALLKGFNLSHIQTLDLTPPLKPEGWGIGVNPAAFEGYTLEVWETPPLTLPQRELLVKADELLSNPRVWVRGREYVRGQYGRHRFCAIGAVRWANGYNYRDGDVRPRTYDDVSHVTNWLNCVSCKLYKEAGVNGIAGVNDHVGYDAVRHVFAVTRNYFNVGRC